MQSVQVGLAGGVENTWLGGHDIGAEGSYVWSDGSSWSFVNWRENHPNNGGTDGNQARTLTNNVLCKLFIVAS